MLVGSSKNSTLKLICLESKSIAKSQEFSNVHIVLFPVAAPDYFLLGGGEVGVVGGGEEVKI